MRGMQRGIAVVLAASALTAGSAVGAPVLWALGDGGNGHYYEIVDSLGITYQAARTAAAASSYAGLGGRILILDPANYDAELNFVFDNVYVPHGGPYLQCYWAGATQIVPASGSLTSDWVWDDGQPVPVTTTGAWFIDHNEGGAPGTAYAAVLFSAANRSLGDYAQNNSGALSYGYVVEYGSGTNPNLLGDYNHDGRVDAADYTVWADHFGQTGTGVPGDGNLDGHVDGADYTIWADHFGQTVSPAAPPAGTVPEPMCGGLLAASAGLTLRRVRRR